MTGGAGISLVGLDDDLLTPDSMRRTIDWLGTTDLLRGSEPEVVCWRVYHIWRDLYARTYFPLSQCYFEPLRIHTE